MQTVVYLIRHSEPFKTHMGMKNAKESILQENEKTPLSIHGEKMAEEFSKNSEFSNLSCVWSSNYVRAMSTAKYFAEVNHLKVNIDERLNERVHGVTSYDHYQMILKKDKFWMQIIKLEMEKACKKYRTECIIL